MDNLWSLKRLPGVERPDGPVCLVVMDGVGLGPEDEGNAWHLASTPVLDRLMAGELVGPLRAHGIAVGMPSDGDMGNSEVGHNALGAGRVFDQGAKLVEGALQSGSLFEGETWDWLLEGCRAGGTLHLMGLWSDGNVHSHQSHAYLLLDRALEAGAKRVRFHLLLDGRDVGETSALDYVEPLEARLAELRDQGHDVAIASAGGRMVITMDRYEADWGMVDLGWRTHVLGQVRGFSGASEAIRALREEQPGVTDQYLPPFVIQRDEVPVGAIEDGDSVVFFNFRGDRAQEISRAFEAPASEPFPFERVRVPDVRFAGMMEYDGDLKLPAHYLVDPPEIDRTVGEYLARNGLRQLACSETQKFGHVTYFFNGNRSGMFESELERYLEVPSDNVEFSQRPHMKASEITDLVLEELDRFKPDFVRLNLANGDMVGHTGVLEAAIVAMEAVDEAVGRLVDGMKARGGVCVILADHGNCETMFEKNKRGEFVEGPLPGGRKACTTHTLNPVPCIIEGEGLEGWRWSANSAAPGLANVAATCLNLLGFEAPQGYMPSLIERS